MSVGSSRPEQTTDAYLQDLFLAGGSLDDAAKYKCASVGCFCHLIVPSELFTMALSVNFSHFRGGREDTHRLTFDLVTGALVVVLIDGCPCGSISSIHHFLSFQINV